MSSRTHSEKLFPPWYEEQPDGAVFIRPLSWKAISATCCPQAHHIVHKYLTVAEWTITNTNRFDEVGNALPDVEVAIKYCPFCATSLPLGYWFE
jgi:hypothetical protein